MMNPEHGSPVRPAFSLRDHCVRLSPNGRMRTYEKGMRRSGAEPSRSEAGDGPVLALYEVTCPDDVHYPAWEMHPEGDELLIVESGLLSVEFREDPAATPVSLASQTACVVPKGVWHRLVVHQPSVLMAITVRSNTVYEMEAMG